ncbi:MAG: hypothetical protein V3S20_06340 [Dehalococcoidia bacterium]
MATKFIVLVADRDDPKHGEIVVVDTTAEAERLVETLLDAGFDQERVRVFTGTEMEAHVSHRPKVELVERGLDEPAPVDGSPAEEEVQPAEALSEAHVAELENENSSSPLFRTPPEKSVEMMPELLH